MSPINLTTLSWSDEWLQLRPNTTKHKAGSGNATKSSNQTEEAHPSDPMQSDGVTPTSSFVFHFTATLWQRMQRATPTQLASPLFYLYTYAASGGEQLGAWLEPVLTPLNKWVWTPLSSLTRHVMRWITQASGAFDFPTFDLSSFSFTLPDLSTFSFPSLSRTHVTADHHSSNVNDTHNLFNGTGAGGGVLPAAMLSALFSATSQSLLASHPELRFTPELEEALLLLIGYAVLTGLVAAWVTWLLWTHAEAAVPQPEEEEEEEEEALQEQDDGEAPEAWDAARQAIVDAGEGHDAVRRRLQRAQPRAGPRVLPPTHVRIIQVMLKQLGQAAKGGLVLFLDLCVVPIGIGCIMDVATFDLFRNSSLEGRRLFFTDHPFIFGGTHWTLGFIFLWTILFLASQFRKIVKPHILKWFIRFPDEVDFNIMQELLLTPLSTQLRRLVIHMSMLCGIVFVGLHVPVRLLHKMVPDRNLVMHVQFTDFYDFSLGVVLLHLVVVLAWQYTGLKDFFEALFQRLMHLIAVVTNVRDTLFMTRPEKRHVQLQLLRREVNFLEQDLAQLAMEEMAIQQGQVMQNLNPPVQAPPPPPPPPAVPAPIAVPAPAPVGAAVPVPRPIQVPDGAAVGAFPALAAPAPADDAGGGWWPLFGGLEAERQQVERRLRDTRLQLARLEREDRDERLVAEHLAARQAALAAQAAREGAAGQRSSMEEWAASLGEWASSVVPAMHKRVSFQVDEEPDTSPAVVLPAVAPSFSAAAAAAAAASAAVAASAAATAAPGSHPLPFPGSPPASNAPAAVPASSSTSIATATSALTPAPDLNAIPSHYPVRVTCFLLLTWLAYLTIFILIYYTSIQIGRSCFQLLLPVPLALLYNGTITPTHPAIAGSSLSAAARAFADTRLSSALRFLPMTASIMTPTINDPSFNQSANQTEEYEQVQLQLQLKQLHAVYAMTVPPFPLPYNVTVVLPALRAAHARCMAELEASSTNLTQLGLRLAHVFAPQDMLNVQASSVVTSSPPVVSSLSCVLPGHSSTSSLAVALWQHWRPYYNRLLMTRTDAVALIQTVLDTSTSGSFPGSVDAAADLNLDLVCPAPSQPSLQTAHLLDDQCPQPDTLFELHSVDGDAPASSQWPSASPWLPLPSFMSLSNQSTTATASAPSPAPSSDFFDASLAFLFTSPDAYALVIGLLVWSVVFRLIHSTLRYTRPQWISPYPTAPPLPSDFLLPRTPTFRPQTQLPHAAGASAKAGAVIPTVSAGAGIDAENAATAAVATTNTAATPLIPEDGVHGHHDASWPPELLLPSQQMPRTAASVDEKDEVVSASSAHHGPRSQSASGLSWPTETEATTLADRAAASAAASAAVSAAATATATATTANVRAVSAHVSLSAATPSPTALTELPHQLNHAAEPPGVDDDNMMAAWLTLADDFEERLADHVIVAFKWFIFLICAFVIFPLGYGLVVDLCFVAPLRSPWYDSPRLCPMV
jgi:hypothetical protein